MAAKTKIVLDADIIIHFLKADQFTLLLDIFPEYEYVILDVVYKEVTTGRDIKTQIDNTLTFFKHRLSSVVFTPKGESIKEYAKLERTLGRGESACMVYCRDNQDVLGSSNLKDIHNYCTENSIVYLTTIDFLYYAFIRKKLTEEECHQFINTVIQKGSKLPNIIISRYTPTHII